MVGSACLSLCGHAHRSGYFALNPSSPEGDPAIVTQCLLLLLCLNGERVGCKGEDGSEALPPAEEPRPSRPRRGWTQCPPVPRGLYLLSRKAPSPLPPPGSPALERRGVICGPASLSAQIPFIKKIVVRYACYKIYHFNHFSVYNSMTVKYIDLVGQPHHLPVSRTYSSHELCASVTLTPSSLSQVPAAPLGSSCLSLTPRNLM